MAPPVYAAVDFAAIMAPALYLKVTADRAGLGGNEGVDLIVASTAEATGWFVFWWLEPEEASRVLDR
jgi:hypothetical protein